MAAVMRRKQDKGRKIETTEDGVIKMKDIILILLIFASIYYIVKAIRASKKGDYIKALDYVPVLLGISLAIQVVIMIAKIIGI